MKILILDESKTDRLFIYGGYIIDADKMLEIKSKINDAISRNLNKPLPHNFELKKTQSDCNKQINKYLIQLETSNDPRLLDYLDNLPKDSTSTGYLSLSDTILLHSETLDVVKQYSDEIKIIVFIFPSLSELSNHNQKFNRYKKAIRCCLDNFERYLKEKNERGMVIIDQLGDDAGKQGIINDKFSSWIRISSFEKIDLILPQIIIKDPLNIINSILGCIGEFAEKHKVDFTNVDELIEKNVCRLGIYPSSLKNICKHLPIINKIKK